MTSFRLPLIAFFLTISLPLGAVEITVDSAADTSDPDDGILTLREAIAGAAAGDTIVFDLALDGSTVFTTGGTLVLDKDLTIDAAVLPAGLRLDAALAHRLLDIPAGSAPTLRGLSLLNGRSTNQNGGAARCFGILTMQQCLVSGCVAGFGGGIFASGASSRVVLQNCTFTGNLCRNSGSAMSGNGGAEFLLSHCTIYGNSGLSSAPRLGAGAGGYFGGTGTVASFHHTIFGDNRDSAGNLINGWVIPGGAQFNSLGYNSTDDSGGAGAQPTDMVNTDPRLGPLEYWGGLTACLRPAADSPIVDAGDPSIVAPPVRDGLGAPRVEAGRVDLGAVERGRGTFDQWCEHFGVTTDPAADDDGDGRPQLDEYVHGTDPDDAADSFTPFSDFDANGGFRLNSRLDTDRADVVLFFQRSADLRSWFASATLRSAAGSPAGTVAVSAAEPISLSEGLQRAFARTVHYLGRPSP